MNLLLWNFANNCLCTSVWYRRGHCLDSWYQVRRSEGVTCLYYVQDLFTWWNCLNVKGCVWACRESMVVNIYIGHGWANFSDERPHLLFGMKVVWVVSLHDGKSLKLESFWLTYALLYTENEVNISKLMETIIPRVSSLRLLCFLLTLRRRRPLISYSVRG